MLKKINQHAENLELKMLRKATDLQKLHIKSQDRRIKNLEGMVTTLMKRQGSRKSDIFAAIHLGELLDDNVLSQDKE